MHRHRGTLALSGLLAALATVNASLATDRTAYAAGEPVTLTLTLRNPTAEPVTLEFPSAQRYDFAIADSGGHEVWRWSAGRMFAQMLGEETLAAGDSLAYSVRFEGHLMSGRYQAVGSVVRMGDPIAATTEFQVR